MECDVEFFSFHHLTLDRAVHIGNFEFKPTELFGQKIVNGYEDGKENESKYCIPHRPQNADDRQQLKFLPS